MARKRSKAKKQRNTEPSTKNEQESLAAITDNNENTTPQSNNKIQTKAPTPIIISTKDLRKYFTPTTFEENLKENHTTNFIINIARNNINLQIKDKNAKNSFIKELQEKDIQYHTYREVEQKTHAFVLRGLEKNPPPSIADIKVELNKLNINTKEIYKMNSPYHTLYLVITDTSHTLDTMQKIHTLMNVNVQWKRHVNKKKIMQCHKCQIWGHAASTCSRKPRCLKCGQDHLTKECTKSSDTPASCANCKGEHPANYSKCPVYLAKLEMGGKPKK